MNLFSVVENMTLETNSMTVLLLVNPIRNSKCRKKDLEQLELVRLKAFMYLLTPHCKCLPHENYGDWEL